MERERREVGDETVLADSVEENRTVHFSNRFVEMVERDGWYYASRTGDVGVAAIVALTENKELVLTEQYRVPIGKRVLDLPAGLTEQGESTDTLETAVRELEEETGFLAERYTKLFDRPTSPGITDEVVSYIRATGLIRLHEGGGLAEEGENITVHVIPIADINNWLIQKECEGVMIDPKIDVALRALATEAG